MPRPSPIAEAAAVFEEAKQLVAEARQSRQRSPIRCVLEHAGESDVLVDINPKRDNEISYLKFELQPLLSGGFRSSAAASIWDKGAASSHAVVRQHDNLAQLPFPTTTRSCIPESDISSQGDLRIRTSSIQLRSLATLDIDAPQHRGDWMAPSGAADLDTDTSGGDQPSRWQMLVRRVNTEVVATASGLSPTKLARSPGSQFPVGGSNTASPMGQCSAAAVHYGITEKVCANSSGLATTRMGRYTSSRDEHGRATTIRRSPPTTRSPDNGNARRRDDARISVTKWTQEVPAPQAVAADGAAATASSGNAGCRHRAEQSNAPIAFASPYERAVAALQQAEQQLRDHKQHRGCSDCGNGSAAASPTNATLAAAERFLATGLPLGHTAVPRNTGKYGNIQAAPWLGTAADVGIAAEGSFEEAAWNIVHRFASSVRLGLGMPDSTVAPSGPLLHSYTVLEPPPAQHVVAAAALAAAAATGGVAMVTSSNATPELELQIEMQSLMAAAREASSEEAMRAKQRLLQQESEAAAAATIAAVENRAVQLARVVIYTRLWGLAAKWSRREAEERTARLRTSRTRCCFAAWRSTARAVRTARLAAEAVELAEATRREEVACRFRRLWLLHYSLAAWRRAAVASVEERRRQAVLAAELSYEQQAEALREATADRFRRLWLLHSHMRTWRAAARAQATARLVAGDGRGAIVSASAAGGCRGHAQDPQRRRTAAVAALLERLRYQREAFQSPAGTPHPSTIAMPSGFQNSGETERAKAGHRGSGGSGPLPPSAPGLPHTSAATATPATAPVKASRPFPGLNKWIRPQVMRSRHDAGASTSGGAAANAPAAVAPLPLPGWTGATVPVPFQLSTSARARYRRNQVLAACDGTRHIVTTAAAGTRVTTAPWCAVATVPTGTAAVWAAGNCEGRSDAPPGPIRSSSAGGSGLSQGGDGDRSRNTDSPLHVLRQVVRRRHQQRVSDTAVVGSGTSGGALTAAGSCYLRAANEELVAADEGTGLSDDMVAVAQCDARMRWGPLNLSSVSSVWSSGVASSAAAVEEEEGARKHDCTLQERSGETREGSGGGDGEHELGLRVHEVNSGADSICWAKRLVVTAAADGADSSKEREDQVPPACVPEGETHVTTSSQRLERQSMIQNPCEPQHDGQQHQRPQQIQQTQLEQSGPSGQSARPPIAPFPTLTQASAIAARGARQRGNPNTVGISSKPTSTGNSPRVLSTTLTLHHNNPRAAVAGYAATFTTVDLERLRATEVRQRRQADEQARRLALELAAHMKQLAGVHHVRALLKWHGLVPWMRMVATARQEAQRADRHFIAGLLRRALLVLSQGAVRARFRVVSGMAAAVAVGWSRRQERLARVVLGRLKAWARAAAFYRRQRSRGVLLGLMRVARAGWAFRVDAVEYWHRRRLWSCLHGWRAAAEQQASEQLLWELERQREVELVLGRRTARRVLAEWRRLGREAVEQRAVLQHRSQQWVKVQGWLAEVQMARERTRNGTHGSSVIAAATEGKMYDGHGHDYSNTGAGATSSLSQSQSLMVEGSSNTGAVVADQNREEGWIARVSRCSSGRSELGTRRVTHDNDDDDPLGLGPLEEQLQQFSLGSSCLGLQVAGGREGAGLGTCTDHWVGESGGRRHSFFSGPNCSTVAPVSDYTPQKWAKRSEGGPMGRPMGPPLLASRQERLARYLERRTTGGV